MVNVIESTEQRKILSRAGLAKSLVPGTLCVCRSSSECLLRVICKHAAAVRFWSASIMKADLIAAGAAGGPLHLVYTERNCFPYS